MIGLLIGAAVIVGTGLSWWWFALLGAAFLADIVLSELL